MKIYYTEDGTIKIELISIEDRIIVNQLFQGKTSGLSFHRTGCNDTYEAKAPNSVERIVSNNVITMVLDPRIDYRELQEFKRQQSKLQAVKYIKDVTGWGLKDSKEYMDERWDAILPQ